MLNEIFKGILVELGPKLSKIELINLSLAKLDDI
jgi:hypothetical protein